jgi:hypothetical protein
MLITPLDTLQLNGKPEPFGRGDGRRIDFSSVALAIFLRPRVATRSNPSPEFQFRTQLER